MIWQERIDSILDQLLQVDEALLKGLVGCTEEDIVTVEKEFGHKLPAAYAALLRRSGRSWGELMKGEDWSYPEMLDYRSIAASLLAEVHGFPGFEDLHLEPRDLVFFMHQGYQFLFFRLGQSEDPKIYYYNGDDPSFQKAYERFTDWVDLCVKEEVKLRSGQAALEGD